MMNQKVKIIGGGLAGVECAYSLSKAGIKSVICDIKPKKFTSAHTSENLGELVCSNSLKSNDYNANACGLLKEEMRRLGSLTMAVAEETKVPAGNALAVDRELFSRKITEILKNDDNVEIVCEEVEEIDLNEPTIIASGPLTTEKLIGGIAKLTGNTPYFFDAVAPIVEAGSIDFDYAFIGDRYGKGNGDYINCPLSRDEYYTFVEELIKGETHPLHDFEDKKVFEGCMAVELMAKRGVDTLRFGMMKPVGFIDEKTGKRPFAIVQLRKENLSGESYNIVGFQTNLKFQEQKRIFSLIPALKNANYLRYGKMHKNAYINAPKLLDSTFALKENNSVYFAGQITGVEGYVESSASGMVAGINMARRILGKEKLVFPTETVIGALSNYVTILTDNYQPMNANYAVLKPLKEEIKDKSQKKIAYANRSLELIDKIKENIYG